MKLYLAERRYYEKQADVPKRTKFEAVEFPFSASPKADFVAWLNACTIEPVPERYRSPVEEIEPEEEGDGFGDMVRMHYPRLAASYPHIFGDRA